MSRRSLPASPTYTTAVMVADSFGNPTHLNDEVRQAFLDLGYRAAATTFDPGVGYFGGQRFDERFSAAETLAATTPTPTRVVLLLGTNDALQAGTEEWDIADSPAWVDAHLALWPDDAVIVIPNVNENIVNKPASQAPAATLNAYIAGLADDRLRIVDWNAAVALDQDLTYDYVHPSAAGQAWLDAAIRQALVS